MLQSVMLFAWAAGESQTWMLTEYLRLGDAICSSAANLMGGLQTAVVNHLVLTLKSDTNTVPSLCASKPQYFYCMDSLSFTLQQICIRGGKQIHRLSATLAAVGRTRWDLRPTQAEERSVCEVCLEHHTQRPPARATEEELTIRRKLIPDDQWPKLLDLEPLSFPLHMQRTPPVVIPVAELTRKPEPPKPPKWMQERQFQRPQILRLPCQHFKNQEACAPIGIKKRCVKVKWNSWTLGHPMGQKKNWQDVTSKIGCLHIGGPVCLSLRIDFYGTKILFQWQGCKPYSKQDLNHILQVRHLFR